MQSQNAHPKAQVLTRLLKRISEGKDPRLLRKQAHELLPSIAADDIAIAERTLIHDGYSAELVHQLCSVFIIMAVLKEHPIHLRDRLPANHTLRKILAEHELIRCFIADLKDVIDNIQQLDQLTDTCCEYRKLAHIIDHLGAMVEHIDEEEDVIFPFLARRSWPSLCTAARDDHVYIRIALDDLARLRVTIGAISFREFKARLSSIAGYLCPAMTEHLFQEDNIIYPIAVEVISNKRLWQRLKAVCDDIGYCGLHM